MLDSNKSTNFNKKSHFKAFGYVSYDTYDFTIRYDLYDTHTVSYDSWTLMIHQYNTKLFTHDMIRIAYRIIMTTMTLLTQGIGQPSILVSCLTLLQLESWNNGNTFYLPSPTSFYRSIGPKGNSSFLNFFDNGTNHTKWW